MRRDIRFAALLAALWVMPVALLMGALLAGSALDRVSVTTTGPTFIAVGSQIDEERQPVVVEVERKLGEQVVSRVDGLITAVDASTPVGVTPGLPLVRIDDVLVRAQLGPSPIVRDVAPGSRGPDVARVRDLLIASGYDAAGASEDVYSLRLQVAIDRWNADAGVPRDGIFRVATTAYIPATVSQISGIAVAVGERIAAGEPVAIGAEQLVRVGFAPVGEEPLADYADADTVLILGTERLPVTVGSIEGESATGLVSALEAAVTEGSATAAVDGNTERYGSVAIALADPKVSATVPSSAVRVDEAGRRCVFVVTGATDDEKAALVVARAQPVALAGPLPGTPALTVVDAELAGATVVADAARMPASRACLSD